MNVADLEVRKCDSLGSPVLYFYARKTPEYAVYQTAERVSVHYADDLGKSDEQRKSLAQLAPLRGEIVGLVDGWRAAPDEQRVLRIFSVANGPKLRKQAERFDRRVGDALIVALEGDLTGAGALLKEIKEDVLEERVGWSRFEYLLTALFVAVGFIVLASVVAFATNTVTCDGGRNPLCMKGATDLWRGSMAGAVGSFFSIALAIRGRTVLPDLHRTSNLMDAALRVAIGIIAAAVLVALVLQGFVRISIGDSSPGTADALYIAIVGFIAGFAERLVPDLLAKAEARTGEAPVLRKPESDAEPKPQKQEPGPNQEQGNGPAQAVADPVPEQAHEDACVTDLPLEPEEVTPDENLPPASGGVAPRADGAAQ